MTKSDGRKIIEGKIAEFHEQEKLLKKKGHGETNIRTNFIDVLFESLGWNMKSYQDVIREYAQKDSSATKKVDYAFFINGRVKFFVEAKESSVDLEHDKDAIYQAKRYAFSTNGRAPIIILTDFEEFRVFNVLKAPLYDNIEKDLLKNYCLQYADYTDKWDMLWGTFSKESVKNGSLNSLIGRIDKNTRTMDVEFLEQITDWREILAKHIAVRNAGLKDDDINEAVQRILDRLIFIRNLEDREIEPENTLLDIAKNKEDVYKHFLIPLFGKFDKVYNGLLFKEHFSEKILLDDAVLKDIIKKMCYPVSPFQFDVIEPEILRRIYEKFLGSKIRLTDSHHAKVEEKMEVRKAGGVYYTPEYIVNYIVENTVGKKIEALSPDEIKNIKIVDPACGSGSFLLGAFTYILNYHEKWYLKNKSDKRYKDDYYITKNGELKVKLEKRAEILKNNIFGVDIDKEATEVAIMSLYLKMLDEGFDKGQKDLFFIKGHVLPDMLDNVKCGNSLIGNDYFDGSLKLDDNKEYKKIKPFDWEKEFAGVFKGRKLTAEGAEYAEKKEDNGGFDVVIGNPPYGAELSEEERKYLENKFNLKSTDTACLFMGLALKLLKCKGINGFIVPKPFVYSSNWQIIREKLLNEIMEIVDCEKVWKEVKLEQIIYILEKNSNINYYKSSIRNEEIIIKIGNIDKKTFNQFGFFLNGISEKELRIGEKILNSGKFLNDFVINQRGAIYQKFIKESGDYKVLGGKQVNRYLLTPDVKGFIPKSIIDDEKAYIKENSLLVQRIVAHIANPIPHIKIIATITKDFNFNNYIIVDTINQLQNVSELKSEFILSIINSKLISWYSYLFIFGKAIRTMQFDNPVSSRIPFRNLNLSNSSDKTLHDSLVSLVDNMLQTQKAFHDAKSEGDKKLFEQKISLIDKKIDDIVYKLYGLTDEEIRIVEGEE